MTTHDYTKRYWGHDYTFDPIDKGQKASMMGWGLGIKNGDYILLQDGPDRSTRYQITKIEYMSDPQDMWSAKAVFAPRPASNTP